MSIRLTILNKYRHTEPQQDETDSIDFPEAKYSI
jgi:hypothetical protein